MKVKLLKQIQKPVFSVGGDDLGKHYEILVMDANTDTFSNFELVANGEIVKDDTICAI